MIKKAEIMRRVKMLQKELSLLADILAAVPDNAEALESLANLPLAPLDGGTTNELMTAKQVQVYLGIGESTFYTWLREGRLPPGEVWGGKAKRWSRASLEAWRRGHRTEVKPIEL